MLPIIRIGRGKIQKGRVFPHAKVGFSPIACKLFLLYNVLQKSELRLMKKEEEGGYNLDGA